MSGPRAFAMLGPLPSGVAVLEASAGTGKTFTIAGLTARYVADGVPLDRILVVTFTRLATGELRERVRERLVSAERALDDALAGIAPPAGDELAQFLADGEPEGVAVRRDRLARAVADFDSATITTTHGFCLDALGSLGFTGDVERGCTFVEDLSDLVTEVVDDLYVRRFWKHPPVLTRGDAAAVVEAAIENPRVDLEPANAPEDTYAAMRVRLAEAAREELERRKRQASVMTFDDLLTRLDAALADPDGGNAVAARLRARYSVALVDEFQDTDPVQWDIMRRAFAHPDSTLVLIGDPKQAIYAFRGADVYAYLDAAAAAGVTETLDVNWRSDQRLLDALDQVFGRAQLGHPGITYHQVRAADANRATRLHGAPVDAALRIRVVDRMSPTIERTKKTGQPTKPSARVNVARDVAQEVVALLDCGAEIDVGTTKPRRVLPGDIAVLVRLNAQASTVRDMLEDVGVPAVINGAGSVFATDGARHWLQLLDALERPASVARAHAAALTPFVGWSAQTVAEADDGGWEDVHDRLHGWAQVLRTSGVASLLQTITTVERLQARMLGIEDGERELTDLRHIGQLLHSAATSEHLGLSALAAWLRRRIDEAGEEADVERTRRLETDAAAVQVLTIHRSKGLEFPIVLCPYLWDTPRGRPGDNPVFFHDPDNADARTLDVGLDGHAYQVHKRRNLEELRGEDLRLAYVALTRAKHLAMVWWAGAWEAQHAPLSRLVFAQASDGTIPADGGDDVPSDEAAFARFEELAAGAPGAISVEWARSRLPSVWGAPLDAEADLAIARFDRGIDHTWRRTSYSDITAPAHDALVASEPESRAVRDEPDEETPAAAESPPVATEPVPLAAMPGGTRVGTLIHELFEAIDFGAEDLAGEISAGLAARDAERILGDSDITAVATGLAVALQTPLGPLLDERPLTAVARSDRVDEMVFELPLAGGDTSRGFVTPAAIAASLRRRLPSTDPLHRYAERLEDPGLRGYLRGYLTGSIDLVLRVPGADGRVRYAIADYKTNRLGDYARPLTAWDHRPEAIEAEMSRSHYMLQGLLYLVALHRYLRFRVGGYDADRDIAGVFYLFVRGMTGPDVARFDGTPAGVFAWKPPGALLDELSDVLDRGGAA